MSKKNLFYITIVFLILSVIISYPSWSPYFKFGKETQEIDFEKISQEKTDKIVIKKDEEVKILTKNGEAWKINEFGASQNQVSDFFQSLGEIKIESVASKIKESYPQFEIDEVKGTFLEFYQGESKKGDFVVGKRGTGLNSFYIRKKGDDNVYLAYGGLKEYLGFEVSDWRDKVVLALSPESIQKIELNYPKPQSPLIVIRTATTGSSTWEVEQTAGKTTSLTEAISENFLKSINPLNAVDFVEDKEEINEFENAKEKTVVLFWDSQEQKLAELFLLEKEDEWWGKLADKETIYKISKYTLEDLLIKEEEIFK